VKARKIEIRFLLPTLHHDSQVTQDRTRRIEEMSESGVKVRHCCFSLSLSSAHRLPSPQIDRLSPDSLRNSCTISSTSQHLPISYVPSLLRKSYPFPRISPISLPKILSTILEIHRVLRDLGEESREGFGSSDIPLEHLHIFVLASRD